MTTVSGQPLRCHIFCTVIDNYGDLGVCWRLARHLAHAHAVAVTLFVDDLSSFQHLAPALDPKRPVQRLGDITIQHWSSDFPAAAPADLVIEGFACHLPESYILAMAACSPPPVWINLEYLSAEDWVEGCHGMASTHPQTGMEKVFWFPGFSPATGGLLRSPSEMHLFAKVHEQPKIGRHISLFSYENQAIAGLLTALASDSIATTLSVFSGRALTDVSAWLGQSLAIGDTAQRGALSIHVLPLLDHADYDHLLARSDLNLVRGEDSFVRAQWAGAPMLWHIYPQEDEAHLIKLAAWQARVERVAAASGTPLPSIWSQALAAWNCHAETASAPPETHWAQLLADLPAIRNAMRSWRDHLLTQPDLATQLMRFYADRVESRPK